MTHIQTSQTKTYNILLPANSVQAGSVQLHHFSTQLQIYCTQYVLLTQADDLLRWQPNMLGSHFFFTHLRFSFNSPSSFKISVLFQTKVSPQRQDTLSNQSPKTGEYLRFKLRCVDLRASTNITDTCSAFIFRVEQSSQCSITPALLGPNNTCIQCILNGTQSSAVSWIKYIMILYLPEMAGLTD